MHVATEFWLTRLCFQRSLGGIYLVAFLIAANQFIPLLGATRVATGPAFCASGPVSSCTEFVLHQLFGSLHHGYDLVRRWVIDFYHQRFLRIVRARRVDAHLGVALDDLPLTRECGPDVLRIRLGNHARRERASWRFFSAHPTRGRP